MKTPRVSIRLNCYEDLLNMVEEKHKEVYKKFQKGGSISCVMYGAKGKKVGIKLKDDEWVKREIEIEDEDPIYDMFCEKKLKKQI